MNKRLSLIIGAVLALLAVFLVRIYLNQQREMIRMQEEKKTVQRQDNQIPVLIAKTDIAPNTLLEPSMFEVAIAPADQVPPQAVTSYAQIVQKEVVAPIAKGEPIMLTKLTETTRRKTSVKREVSLSAATPKGKRAITIPVDNIASVGGMIKPGDYVDLLCLLSPPQDTDSKTKTKEESMLPLFQNVLILAVDSETIGETEAGAELPGQEGQAAPKAKASAAKTVTLALTPQEANIIAFAQEQGKIRLVLRSSGDTLIEQTSPISWETLLLFLESKGKTGKEVSPEGFAPKAVDTIEIYRGAQRELVPLTK